ncbi:MULTISPECIES: hypothetical protein [Niastella]|uniref:Uncharacterized protein n=1 Tax=Niastella soli TaxID=2821487 RepID=A0ABS3YUQ6_9BACT|nr:hypothetical protein [Niastella soli]MBO9201564.1 hypothetical protein [Niastella soli]
METTYKIQPSRNIEVQGSKQSPNMFLWLLVSAILTLMFKVGRQKRKDSFIAKWVAPIMLYGILNKIKKQLRRDLTKKA